MNRSLLFAITVNLALFGSIESATAQTTYPQLTGTLLLVPVADGVFDVMGTATIVGDFIGIGFEDANGIISIFAETATGPLRVTVLDSGNGLRFSLQAALLSRDEAFVGVRLSSQGDAVEEVTPEGIIIGLNGTFDVQVLKGLRTVTG